MEDVRPETNNYHAFGPELGCCRVGLDSAGLTRYQEAVALPLGGNAADGQLALRRVSKSDG